MIARWCLTFAFALPMAWVFRVLNAERLQRGSELFLPDKPLPWDEFQAAIAAEKSAVAMQSWLVAGGLGVVVAVCAAVFAAVHLFAVRRPVILDARFHWLWIAHSIMPFAAIAIGLVAMLRV